MKGVAFRKLSRTTSHRNALLRNLVTSLFQHDRISTTVAKAKEAQRQAEKIITKVKRSQETGRRGAISQWRNACAYIYSPEITGPIMQRLGERYADRPGGYTRIHLFGNRPGDNAPRALLELVDNDKGDIKLEMTARAMGREALLAMKRKSPGVSTLRLDTKIFTNYTTKLEEDPTFNELTRLNIEKVIKYQPEKKRQELYKAADEHFRRLCAASDLEGPRRFDMDVIQSDFYKKYGAKATPGSAQTLPVTGRQYLAGVGLPDLPVRSDTEVDEDGDRILGHRKVVQPMPLRGKKKSSVVRLGKGSFAKKVDHKVNPKSYASARASAVRW